MTRFRGPWAGKLNTYMGIKFLINWKYHYGWIGLTHPGGGERVLIEKYAYNKTRNNLSKPGNIDRNYFFYRFFRCTQLVLCISVAVIL